VLEKVKKLFTILLFSFTSFHPPESILFNIEFVTQVIIISISSTQKDTRNYLLACQEKGRSHLFFLPRLLTCRIFLFRYLFILPIKFLQRAILLSLNTNCNLKILIKNIKSYRVTRIENRKEYKNFP